MLVGFCVGGRFSQNCENFFRRFHAVRFLERFFRFASSSSVLLLRYCFVDPLA